MEEPQEVRWIEVVLARAAEYGEAAVVQACTMLDSLALPVSSGDKVLVKPNMLRADMLTCTNATLIAGVCRYLLDKGCRVTIGDSPGFGTAKGIAKVIGLESALATAGCAAVPLITLDHPVKKPLSLGGYIGLSRYALDADVIFNIPKLKAHVQMRVTGAVKNLFGCISGIRKALVHTRYGDKETGGIALFPSAVADILGHLPPVISLMDGITAMHVRGPSGGKAFPAHVLAASASPVALDTVVYTMLGVCPEEVPLWQELQRRKAPGAFLEDIVPCGEAMSAYDLSGFQLPSTLMPQTFNPARLAVSTAKRLWARLMPLKA